MIRTQMINLGHRRDKIHLMDIRYFNLMRVRGRKVVPNRMRRLCKLRGRLKDRGKLFRR
jgi:hypothetical protein